MPRANWVFIGNLEIPFPPDPDEQRAITTFLDRQTAKIDALIAKKRELIVALHEQRSAIISHAVTKGLNPDVPMKDSGIEWLGAIPSHWDSPRVKMVARLESGHTPSRNVPEYWENCTIPWVSLADVGRLRSGKTDYIFETEEKISELGLANSAARLLPARTVILSRTASVGFSAILGLPMATTQDFVNWICGDNLIPEFLLQCFRAMKQEFESLTMGSTHQTIYMPDVARFRIPLPPLEEQRAIISHVNREIKQIDFLIEKTEETIERLQEYRAALISAAVTGKIDVRGA
jgi:type I restriction enzyme S subunit